MEIKINCHAFENESDGSMTYLFEGDRIVHKFCGYDNLTDFRKRWNEIATGKNGQSLGIPLLFWDEKNEDARGYLLLINYYDINNEFNYIIVKNATVFITCKGQTIDKIMVD